MKKNLSLVFALLLIVSLLAGCSGGEPTGNLDDVGTTGSDTETNQNESASQSELTGATMDILQKILGDSTADIGAEDPFPIILNEKITQENAPGMLGISSDDFVSFVEDAMAGIDESGESAFQVAVLKCKDVSETESVAAMIQNGFDSSKWVFVFPEQSLTMISGEYILLAVGTAVQTDAIASAFQNAAGGSVADSKIFYKGEVGGGDTTPEDANTSEVLGSEG